MNAFRRKTNYISLFFDQRNMHIPDLLVTARTFSCSIKTATESCSLKQVFLKNIQNH